MALNRQGYEDRIPEYTLNQLDCYVEDRLIPGGFLLAVLSNDLFGAVNRADSANQAALADIVKFVYNRMPAGCWGSQEKVYAYVEEKFYEKLVDTDPLIPV